MEDGNADNSQQRRQMKDPAFRFSGMIHLYPGHPLGLRVNSTPEERTSDANRHQVVRSIETLVGKERFGEVLYVSTGVRAQGVDGATKTTSTQEKTRMENEMGNTVGFADVFTWRHFIMARTHFDGQGETARWILRQAVDMRAVRMYRAVSSGFWRKFWKFFLFSFIFFTIWQGLVLNSIGRECSRLVRLADEGNFRGLDWGSELESDLTNKRGVKLTLMSIVGLRVVRRGWLIVGGRSEFRKGRRKNSGKVRRHGVRRLRGLDLQRSNRSEL